MKNIRLLFYTSLDFGGGAGMIHLTVNYYFTVQGYGSFVL